MASPHVAGGVALCISRGACPSNSTPAKNIIKLRGDAAAAPASFGFLEDPLRLTSGRYYGYLTYAAAYK